MKTNLKFDLKLDPIAQKRALFVAQKLAGLESQLADMQQKQTSFYRNQPSKRGNRGRKTHRTQSRQSLK